MPLAKKISRKTSTEMTRVDLQAICREINPFSQEEFGTLGA
jgi:hypothetical protein